MTDRELLFRLRDLIDGLQDTSNRVTSAKQALADALWCVEQTMHDIDDIRNQIDKEA